METVIAFLLGLMAGMVSFALLLPAMNKRVRAQHQAEVEEYEQALAELRQERADDRETNRRLRRELAVNTPERLHITQEERDRALDELDQLNAELMHATSELADRDRSLREARLAIHDIRVQLERDRFALGAQEARSAAAGAAARPGDPDQDGGEPVDLQEYGHLDEFDDLTPALSDSHRGGRPDTSHDGSGRQAGTTLFDEYPVGGTGS